MSAVNLTEFFSVIEESERLGDSDSTGVAPRFSVPREGFLILGWRNTYGTHWFDRERVGEGISAFSNERKGGRLHDLVGGAGVAVNHCFRSEQRPLEFPVCGGR